MVKNAGGNKTKKGSRKKIQMEAKKRSLAELMKTDGQEYAAVRKINGGGRFNVIGVDKVERIGIARATLKRNKKFIEVGQLILVSLRDFEEKFCDILDIYDGSEVEMLVRGGLIDATFISQHIGQKDITGNNEKDDFGGFSIRHNADSDESDEEDEKTTNSRPSLDDIWDDI